ERADLELVALVDSGHVFEVNCVLFFHLVLPFEPDAGSLCAGGGADRGGAGWFEPRCGATFHLYFTLQLRAKPCQRVGLGVSDRAPEFDDYRSHRARARAAHPGHHPGENGGAGFIVAARAFHMFERDFRLLVREIDLYLRLVEHEQRLRRLAQHPREMLASAGRDCIDLPRTTAVAFRPQLDQPIAREFLERRINRAVRNPVEETNRVLEALLQVVAGCLRLHQKTQDRKLHVHSRWRLAELRRRSSWKKQRAGAMAPRSVRLRCQRHLMHTYRANSST